MQHIRFEDGDTYERGMSPWSRLAGETFLIVARAQSRVAMARRRMWNWAPSPN